MHVHPPKPVHGWRAFFGEVGIIVLGVLIALGFEQVVEHWREAKLAREAQEAIRSEIGYDIGRLALRMRTSPCIERRFEEISTFINRAGSGQAADTLNWIGRPQIWSMNDTRWTAASQSGRVSLLSDERQAQFSDIYGSLKAIQDAETAEQILWAQLRSLEGQTRLSDTAASDMRSVLSQARLMNWRIRVAFDQSKERARELGIPIKVEEGGSRSICIASHTQRPDAVRQIASPYGEP